MKTTGLIPSAARFADLSHAGQTRKYNNHPYIVHPMRVAGIASTLEFAYDELVAAAWLHDVCEDCGVSLELIGHKFGSDVQSLVEHLTNPSSASPHLPRAKRKEIDRQHIACASPDAKVLKLIDRLDNLRDIDRNDKFAVVYANESKLLLNVIRDASLEIAIQVECIINEITSPDSL